MSSPTLKDLCFQKVTTEILFGAFKIQDPLPNDISTQIFDRVIESGGRNNYDVGKFNEIISTVFQDPSKTPLKTINVSNVSSLSFTSLSKLLRAHPKLQSLDIQNCKNIYGTNLHKLLKRNVELKEISLDWKSCKGSDFIRSLKTTKNPLQSIEKIVIDHSNATVVQKSLKNFSPIKFWSKKSSRGELDHLVVPENLRHLEITECTDLLNLQILDNLENLETLCLYGATISGQVFDKILQIKTLRNLDISFTNVQLQRSSSEKVFSLEQLVRKFQNFYPLLETLDISGISYADLKAIEIFLLAYPKKSSAESTDTLKPLQLLTFINIDIELKISSNFVAAQIIQLKDIESNLKMIEMYKQRPRFLEFIIAHIIRESSQLEINQAEQRMKALCLILCTRYSNQAKDYNLALRSLRAMDTVLSNFEINELSKKEIVETLFNVLNRCIYCSNQEDSLTLKLCCQILTNHCNEQLKECKSQHIETVMRIQNKELSCFGAVWELYAIIVKYNESYFLDSPEIINKCLSAHQSLHLALQRTNGYEAEVRKIRQSIWRVLATVITKSVNSRLEFLHRKGLNWMYGMLYFEFQQCYFLKDELTEIVSSISVDELNELKARKKKRNGLFFKTRQNNKKMEKCVQRLKNLLANIPNRKN